MSACSLFAQTLASPSSPSIEANKINTNISQEDEYTSTSLLSGSWKRSRHQSSPSQLTIRIKLINKRTCLNQRNGLMTEPLFMLHSEEVLICLAMSPRSPPSLKAFKECMKTSKNLPNQIRTTSPTQPSLSLYQADSSRLKKIIKFKQK